MKAADAAALAGHYAHVVASGGVLTPEQAAELAALLKGCVVDLVELDQHREKRAASRRATADRVRRHRERNAEAPSDTPVTPVTVTDVTNVTPLPPRNGPPSPCTPNPPFNPPSPELPSANADAPRGGGSGRAKRKGEAAPYMGEVGRVWGEVYPGSAPPRGAADALRPAFREHAADVVLPRLAAYLRATPAKFVNLPKFAASVLAPDWTPQGEAAGTTPAERIADVLIRADAVAVDAETAKTRLTMAANGGTVPLELAREAWRMLNATGGIVPRDRTQATHRVTDLLAVAASKSGNGTKPEPAGAA